MRRAHFQPHKAARRYLQAQPGAAGPNDLPELLAGAARHLVERLRIKPDDARDVALAAWSEIEGERTRCYVDLDISTAHLLFLVDPVAGVRRPIPVVDLVRILGPRPIA